MGQVNLQKMRERLQQERVRLAHERDQLRGTDGVSGEAGDATDLDFNHPGDAGTETFQRTKDLALRATIGGMLAQVDTALAKIDAGTYGKCDQCSQPIAAGRLDAIPYATLCVSCQDRLESSQ